jgi:hypothetical protein
LNNHPTEAAVVPRDEHGKYLPGGPGGPGRARGLSHSEKVRILLEPERENLIGRALALTQHEDGHVAVNALKTCLERLAPAPRQQPEHVEIPDLVTAVTVGDKAQAILRAVGAGTVSPESGEKLLRMLDVVSRVVKLDELDARLRAVEAGKRVIQHDDPLGLDLI